MHAAGRTSTPSMHRHAPLSPRPVCYVAQHRAAPLRPLILTGADARRWEATRRTLALLNVVAAPAAATAQRVRLIAALTCGKAQQRGRRAVQGAATSSRHQQAISSIGRASPAASSTAAAAANVFKEGVSTHRSCRYPCPSCPCRQVLAAAPRCKEGAPARSKRCRDSKQNSYRRCST